MYNQEQVCPILPLRLPGTPPGLCANLQALPSPTWPCAHLQPLLPHLLALQVYYMTCMMRLLYHFPCLCCAPVPLLLLATHTPRASITNKNSLLLLHPLPALAQVAPPPPAPHQLLPPPPTPPLQVSAAAALAHVGQPVAIQ